MDKLSVTLPDESPAPVVHPISAEHKLEVGDVVESRKYGKGVVTAPHGYWYGGVGVKFDADGSGRDYDPMDGWHRRELGERLTRIAHAGQVPERVEPKARPDYEALYHALFTAANRVCITDLTWRGTDEHGDAVASAVRKLRSEVERCQAELAKRLEGGAA